MLKKNQIKKDWLKSKTKVACVLLLISQVTLLFSMGISLCVYNLKQEFLVSISLKLVNLFLIITLVMYGVFSLFLFSLIVRPVFISLKVKNERDIDYNPNTKK